MCCGRYSVMAIMTMLKKRNRKESSEGSVRTASLDRMVLQCSSWTGYFGEIHTEDKLLSRRKHVEGECDLFACQSLSYESGRPDEETDLILIPLPLEPIEGGLQHRHIERWSKRLVV